MQLILIILLILILVGAFPAYSYGGWPAGGSLGLIFIIILIVLLFGNR